MTETDTEAQTASPPVVRTAKGQFVKGVSGNPLGRVKGTKNKITLERLMLEAMLREELTKTGPKLMKKALAMALSGNDRVMRVLLDKMLATPRGDDNDNAADRDVQITIHNHTGPKDAKPVIEGTAITVNPPPSKGTLNQ